MHAEKLRVFIKGAWFSLKHEAGAAGRAGTRAGGRAGGRASGRAGEGAGGGLVTARYGPTMAQLMAQLLFPMVLLFERNEERVWLEFLFSLRSKRKIIGKIVGP